MLNSANLFASILFSSIGMAGLAYGRKAGYLYPILLGAALMFFPYFVSQTWMLYAVGIALSVALVKFHDR